MEITSLYNYVITVRVMEIFHNSNCHHIDLEQSDNDQKSTRVLTLVKVGMGRELDIYLINGFEFCMHSVVF